MIIRPSNSKPFNEEKRGSESSGPWRFFVMYPTAVKFRKQRIRRMDINHG
jgi:hypothetical protein